MAAVFPRILLNLLVILFCVLDIDGGGVYFLKFRQNTSAVCS